MSKQETAIVVAQASNRAIGKNNQLLWHLPADMRFFKALTSHHIVIMGRKTYESIGRPLPNRINIIISRNTDFEAAGCFVFHSLEEALNHAKSIEDKHIYIIGGDSIYKQSIGLVNKIYLTQVHQKFEADSFFPKLDKKEWLESKREDFDADEKNAYPYSFLEYSKRK